MDWQHIAIIISALTFLRLIIKDFIDIHNYNQSKRKKGKRKASKTSRKSPKRKR
ncbi:hypothetical protein [Paenibacillus odorifer]|uniref:hypothetical protein n=1 Tax=Paenibacillus odorifer TaxID=189426 RepID=UPI0015C34D91|nr:hypothetical protein [Paenibacillus odorifer]